MTAQYTCSPPPPYEERKEWGASTTEKRSDEAESAVSSFIASHPKPVESAARIPLPCPVVIPQRRLGNKERGFVEAYAPVLEQCGIDQDTFLDFIREFN